MNSDTGPKDAPKRRSTSLPLLVGLVVVGIGAYFAGPTVLTYVIYLQEKKSTVPVAPATASSRAPGPGALGGAPSGVSAPGGRVGSGGMNPDAIFQQRDEDGNGKLEGGEISERMQARKEELDKDQDGAISKEEFLTGMQGRQSGASRPPSDNGSEPSTLNEDDAPPKNAETPEPGPSTEELPK